MRRVWADIRITVGISPYRGPLWALHNCETELLTLRLLDTSPTGHFAYETFHLLDILPTTWTVCLQIAHFANKTTRIKSNV